MIRFEWDSRKADLNYRKHNVSFQEAATVFTDPLASIFYDSGHSEAEPREIIIGHSTRNRLLLVSFTERAGNVVRLISARAATKREKEDYEEKRSGSV